MRHTLLVILAVAISISNGVGQDKQIIDSLKNLLSKPVADSAKFNAYVLLGKKYIDTNDSLEAVSSFQQAINFAVRKKLNRQLPTAHLELGYFFELVDAQDLALTEYDQAIVLGKKYGVWNEAARGHNYKSFVFNNRGNARQSIKEAEASLELYKRIGAKKNIARLYNVLGLRHHAVNDDDVAITYFNSAMNLADEINDEGLQINVTINMGLINQDRKNYDIAKTFYEKAKTLAAASGTNKQRANINNNLAVTLFSLDKIDEAIALFLENEELTGRIKLVDLYNSALVNLAECYSRKNEFDKAAQYFNKALEQERKRNDVEGIAINYNGQANLLLNQNQPQQALVLANQAIQTAFLNSGLTRYVSEFMVTKARCYKLLGDTNRAFALLDSAATIKDKYLNEKSNQELLELSARYETERKDTKISLLKKVDSINTLQLSNQSLALRNNQLKMSSQQQLIANGAIKISLQQEILERNKLEASLKEEQLHQLHEQDKIQDLQIRNQQLESRQKTIYMIVTGLVFITVLISGYVYLRRSSLEKEKLLQQQLDDELTKKAEEISLAEEKERQRISRDLHDNMGAYTTALLSNVQRMKQQQGATPTLTKMEDNAQQILSSLRETIWMLNNKSISVNDLSDTFKNYCVKILQNFDDITFDAEENIREDKIIPAVRAIHIYKVLQECFQNALKHAAPSQITFIVNSNGALSFRISDNGKGFEIDDVRRGNGLENMAWRVREAEFTLEINSTPGAGTVVFLKEK